MKINLNFTKLLDNKRFVQVISILIAVIAWLIVAMSIDPIKVATISDVPLTISQNATTPDMLSIVDGMDQKVSIKVQGKRYRIGNLKASDFVVTPVISTVVASGEQSVALNVEKANKDDSDFEIISYPTSIKLNFDHLSEHTFDLVGSADNITADDGYIKENIVVNPQTLSIKGPKTELDKIKSCVVITDEKVVSKTTVVKGGTLTFIDKDGKEFTPKYISYDNSIKFELSVPIYKEKTVPLQANFLNMPDGINFDGMYTLSQKEIKIRGPENIIDNIESIPLEPIIDFRTVDKGATFKLKVSMPSTALINTDNITDVTLTVNDIDLAKTIINVNHIITKNEPADYNIVLKTKIINNVKITGKIEDIQNLSSKDLIAVLDFSENPVPKAGSQSYTVTIYATANKFVWPVGTYTVVATATAK